MGTARSRKEGSPPKETPAPCPFQPCPRLLGPSAHALHPQPPVALLLGVGFFRVGTPVSLWPHLLPSSFSASFLPLTCSSQDFPPVKLLLQISVQHPFPSPPRTPPTVPPPPNPYHLSRFCKFESSGLQKPLHLAQNPGGLRVEERFLKWPLRQRPAPGVQGNWAIRTFSGPGPPSL